MFTFWFRVVEAKWLRGIVPEAFMMCFLICQHQPRNPLLILEDSTCLVVREFAAVSIGLYVVYT
jgi:hypothetical protein